MSDHRASISERRAAAAAPQVQRALECLQKLDFLEGCSLQFLRNLASGTTSKIIGPGELIFRAGAEAAEIVLMRRGSAEAVSRQTEYSSPLSRSGTSETKSATSETTSQDEEVCATFTDGATIGHPRVLCGQQPATWSYSLKAAECCEYCVLTRKAFKAASTLYPAEGAKANAAVEAGAIGDDSPRSKRMNRVMTRKMSMVVEGGIDLTLPGISRRPSLRRNLAGFQLVEFHPMVMDEPVPGAMGRRMTLARRTSNAAPQVGLPSPPLTPRDRRRSTTILRRGSVAAHTAPDALAWLQAQAAQAGVALQAGVDMGRTSSSPGPASPKPAADEGNVRKTQSIGVPTKRGISFAAIIEEEVRAQSATESRCSSSSSCSSDGEPARSSRESIHKAKKAEQLADDDGEVDDDSYAVQDGEPASASSKVSTPMVERNSATAVDDEDEEENDDEDYDSFAVQDWSMDEDVIKEEESGEGESDSEESDEDDDECDTIGDLPSRIRPSVSFAQFKILAPSESDGNNNSSRNSSRLAMRRPTSMTGAEEAARVLTANKHLLKQPVSPDRASMVWRSADPVSRIRASVFNKLDTRKSLGGGRGNYPAQKTALARMPRASSFRGLGAAGNKRASLGAVITSAVKEQQENMDLVAQKIHEGNQDSLKTWAFAQQAQSEGNDRDLAAWLDQIPFFSTMDAFVFERLLPLFEKKTFKVRQHLLTQGQITDSMHVIYAGQVAVMLNGDEVATLGPQAVVGERVCILESEAPKSNASIVAQSSVVVTICMQREILVGLMARDAWMKAKIDEQFESLKENRGECSVHNMALFKDADPSFAKMLEVSMTYRTYKPGSVIVSEHDSSTEAFVISGGCFQVSVGGEALATHTVRDSNHAIIFGEFNVVGLAATRDMTVTAVATCRVQIIYQDALKKVFDEFPQDSFIFRRLVEDMEGVTRNFTLELARAPKSGKSIGTLLDCDEELDFTEDDIGDDDEDGSASHSTRVAEGDLPSLPSSLPGSRRGSKRASGVSRHSTSENLIFVTGNQPSRPSSALLSNLLQPDKTSRPASRPGTRPGSRRGSTGGPTMASQEFLSSASQHQRLSGLDLVGRKGTGNFKQPVYLHARIPVSNDLGPVQDLKGCSQKFISRLSLQQQPRLYMPQQALLREGVELKEILVLQRGTCSMTLYKDDMPPLKSPCMVAGLMTLQTPTSFATVIALETCFVAAIPKHCFASVLDAFPTDRRRIFAKTHKSFTDFADAFQEPRLYILFEGYCHLLVEDTVVGTISNRMVFGEMDVFEISDKLGHRNPIVKTVDLCKVGTIRQYSLFEAFQKHPEERPRFERLVHNRLEASVYSQISSQPCFMALSGATLTRVCHTVERQLYLPRQDIIREGNAGDALHIVNRGKVEVVFNGIIVGLLGPGKSFGAAQLLGIARENHATLLTRATSHVLKLSRKSLVIITIQGQEKKWMRAWEAKAKVEYASDMQIFRRKLREQKQLARLGMTTKMTNANTEAEDHFNHDCVAKELLRTGFASWREHWRVEQRKKTYAFHAQLEALGMEARNSKKLSAYWYTANAGQGGPQRSSTTFFNDESPGGINATNTPIMYSRGLRRVELDDRADRGAMSTESWHHYAQSRRLDLWRGAPAPAWLVAVRSEIPKQLQALKAAERGEDTQLGGLVSSVGYMLGS